MNGYPIKQGLYAPEREHDACGIGFVANLKREASHEIVKQAIHMLRQLDHRGGVNNGVGDGAGILVQIPHSYFQNACNNLGFSLPEPGRYAVGMVFLPSDQLAQKQFEERLEFIVQQEGQHVLGWRDTPIDIGILSQLSSESQPVIRQVFIEASEGVADLLAFERKLYVIRKQLEKSVEDDAYFVSLSSRTIVYKGMLTPEQLGAFYMDLQDPLFTSMFAMVHNRFSTNTFPSWKRAHPYRYLLHNGEINTLQGNINWMIAREKRFDTPLFGEDLAKIHPILDLDGTDSAILDNCFEFLVLTGRSPVHAAMMMIPSPWEHDHELDDSTKAFYEYHSGLMEPWDGPTAITFTDGKQVGAILDRNGLRPARYYVTTEGNVIFSSEVGVVPVPDEKIAQKGRLKGGQILLVDLDEGRIIEDKEIKEKIAKEHPYRHWIQEQMVELDHFETRSIVELRDQEIISLQQMHGYTHEELNKNLLPMVIERKDPIGSMGSDTPLAVLSNRPQLLYNYFKQSFAQVTNPPIDAIREVSVTSTRTLLGKEGDFLHPTAQNARRILVNTPILSEDDFSKLVHNSYEEFQVKKLCTLFSADDESELEQALEKLFDEADQAIREGYSLIVLSDRGTSPTLAPIPALLAVSGLHHHLVRQGTRTKVSIICEPAEARDVHQLAMLIGYGADAIHPYLATAIIRQCVREGLLSDDPDDAVTKYIQTATEGIVKIMSKMGISTIQSYRGAQIFEAIGIHSSVIDRYFTRTPSQIGGITLDVIARETLLRHQRAFPSTKSPLPLDSGSQLQWRRNGEAHAYSPQTIHLLQRACRQKDYSLFQKYSAMMKDEEVLFLRSLLDFRQDRTPVPLEEVEPVESIVKRFKTGAMSFGSLSKEAHETLAIAMNRLGAKSNSGEGGEDPNRYMLDEQGDSRASAIKQVASGRFGVTSQYLVNAQEIQIKMAQGAKPGEGGHLPGSKVYPWIAEVRGSTPGVGLISPPPHHDIYSIEDLAQLIHDLKNANPKARISVKLVAKAGVGTIAAGVAKAKADGIVISGHDGGTGASPRSSIQHAGVPWELGLAEVNQTLLLNNLRDRIVIETDGKLMTGRDVVIAALLGAEEFGFATAPLVVLGCIMMRACHLDTCPVGVATQNPELRKHFTGDPEHVVTFMRFIAQEVRELMARLGFHKIDEMVGRTDVLQERKISKTHWKAKHLDLSSLLYQPEVDTTVGRYQQKQQNHQLEESLDAQFLLPLAKKAIQDPLQPTKARFSITNTDRVVGTMLGWEITKKYGEKGLPEDTISVDFYGSAGQSFGSFIPNGLTLTLVGDANDYVGKGLSGGKIIIHPAKTSVFQAEKNVVIGNAAFYGATSGEAYINGIAGERFGVRNSGIRAVVEGVGDHGCEYMTGGKVVILGPTGKNFAAGMSGGIAYVLAEEKESFLQNCNLAMVDIQSLQDKKEIKEVQQMIQRHVKYTGSDMGQRVLQNWNERVGKFVKVIAHEYSKMIQYLQETEERKENTTTLPWDGNQKKKPKAATTKKRTGLA
ncbi:glutamate synthase large subunit [Risungbinella massiliensis]|uniref:glutamate synthase large subunit n=1 Tax=Risungbinella massiliensis TaxID=1329796 RepID=UPI0005CC4A1C|nr:glutamate synthase large subunit [Risungbinella massiliensis]